MEIKCPKPTNSILRVEVKWHIKLDFAVKQFFPSTFCLLFYSGGGAQVEMKRRNPKIGRTNAMFSRHVRACKYCSGLFSSPRIASNLCLKPPNTALTLTLRVVWCCPINQIHILDASPFYFLTHGPQLSLRSAMICTCLLYPVNIPRCGEVFDDLICTEIHV